MVGADSGPMLVPRYRVVVCVCVRVCDRPVQLDDSHTSNSVSGPVLVGVREESRAPETDDFVGVVDSALLSRAVPYSSVVDSAERSVADR